MFDLSSLYYGLACAHILFPAVKRGDLGLA